MYHSVVQRQLYLLSSDPSLTIQAAYDIARKEFYFHRHLSELETRIQKEEALWTGAYFGKTTLQIGLELEDKSYEDWRLWADKQIKEEELKRAGAYGGQQMLEDEEMEGVDGAVEEVDEMVDEMVNDRAPPPAM
jgi:small subunit ribosomal protein S23